MVRVNARLRFLNNMRAHAAMLRFSIDDRVCFQATDGRRVAETLVRYNQKSVSVLAAAGRCTRVCYGPSNRAISRLQRARRKGQRRA